MGFTHLFHCFQSVVPPSQTPLQNDQKIVPVGYDLGSLNYLLASMRLEFTRLEFLNLNNESSSPMVKPFTYAELVMYPTLKTKMDQSIPNILKDSLRLSLGFGVSISVNQMISVLLYFNSLNFNPQGGDRERTGYLNVNLGFF
jgi:hypothetical protein